MSRVQLALKVSDLDASIRYYQTLFATAPHKIRPGYANFAIAEPPLKLVLIEDPAAVEGQLDHLGVEVSSADDVASAATRLAAEGLATDERTSELCCHAVMDKVWVSDPDGARWEVYTILDDQPATAGVPSGADLPVTANACC